MHVGEELSSDRNERSFSQSLEWSYPAGDGFGVVCLRSSKSVAVEQAMRKARFWRSFLIGIDLKGELRRYKTDTDKFPDGHEWTWRPLSLAKVR